MSQKWIAFLVFIWVSTAVLADIMAGSSPLGSHGEESQLSFLTSWIGVTSEESWSLWEMPGFVLGFFGVLWNVMTFQAARETFLTGWAELVVWIVLAPIMVATVWGVVSIFLGLFQKVLS